MRNVRRYYVPNAFVFISAVTRHRRPVFDEDRWVKLLFETMRSAQEIHPFHLLAYAILPDHLHWLMRTSEEVTDSQVMHSIKRNYTRNYKAARGITTSLSLWQDRFWDHVVRDEDDLWRHFDYIHYNPVKHGLVSCPADWPWSSYPFWLEHEYYEIGWGHEEPASLEGMDLE
jgi:putative transposase